MEYAGGMRREGGDYQWAALGLGDGARVSDHGLMALVKSVEIAQCDNRVPQMLGNRPVARQPLHGAGL